MTLAEEATRQTTTDPVVEVTGAWKLHKLGDEVVKALVAADLTVLPGEFVCLMGPSGSGKSTLLNMIGGLDRPTKGTVAINGQDTAALTESQFAALRHDTIGYIFQSYNLIPFLSAVENVELPLMFEPYDRTALRKRAVELLEMVGLGHRIDHAPPKMSGGEQERTAIARSLIGNPRPILADARPATSTPPPSPAPVPRTRGSPPPTSRRRTSTTAPAPPSSACCGISAPTSASPSSPRPTTRRSPRRPAASSA